MRVVAVNSSPRGNDSNTGRMVQAIFTGMNSAGAQTEQIYLKDYVIKPCGGCFACWTKTPGKCIIEDDMAGLLERVFTADLVIYASPLYVDNVTATMKMFMDRIIPTVHPFFVYDEKGEIKHPKRNPDRIPGVMVVSNCGFPGIANFQVMDLQFERLARNASSRVVARVYRTTGELLRNNIPPLEPVINAYMAKLEQAGAMIVNKGAISAELQQELDAPLVDEELYVQAANHHWQESLSHLNNV